MASGTKSYVFRVSHEFVIDAESVERGHRVWAMYLAERLRRSEEQKRKGTESESSA